MPSKKKQSVMPDFALSSGRAAPGGRTQNGGPSVRPSPSPPALGGADSADPGDGTLAAVRELQRLLGEMTGTLHVLSERVEASQARTEAVERRMEEAESRIGMLEDQLAPLLERNTALLSQVRDLHRRIEDQEGRGRRHNVRITGVPEGLTMRRPELRMEVIIRQALATAKLSPFFLIERAHRTLHQQPPPGAPPRPMVCRIFNFRDRDAILAAAREAGEIHWEGNRLCFFPDFTLEVQQKRKKFEEVKKMLRAREVRYAMLFPARLRVQHGGKAHFFTEPTRAAEFIECHIKLPTSRTPRSTPAAQRSPVPAPLNNGEVAQADGPDSPQRQLDPEIQHLAAVIDSWAEQRAASTRPGPSPPEPGLPDTQLSDDGGQHL